MKKFLKKILFIIMIFSVLPLSAPIVSADAAVTEVYSLNFESGYIPKRLTFKVGEGEKENPVYVENVDGNNVLKFDVTKSITANLELGGYTKTSDIELKPQSGVYELEYKIRYFKTGNNKYPFFAAIAESSAHNLYMSIIREWPTMRSTLTYANELNYSQNYNTKDTNLKAEDNWYKVRIVIDTTYNSAKYFIGNTYIGMQDDLYFNGISYKNGVQNFKFVFAPGDTGSATLYLDDIVIRKYESIAGLGASNLKIYGNDGDILERVSSIRENDVLSAKVSLVDKAGSDEKVQFVIALYNNGMLTDIKHKFVDVGNEVTNEKLEIIVKNTENLEIKAFAWNEDFSPLTEMVQCGKYVDGLLHKEVLDFEAETSKGGFDEIYQLAERVEGDNRTEGIFKFSEKRYSQSYAIKKLEKTISDEVFHLSFDYKPSNYINKFWIRTMGSGSAAQLFYDGGTVSYFPDMTNWNRADNGAVYDRGKWQHIDIYVDLDGSTAYYYMNDKLYATTVVSENITDIKSVQFTDEGSYGDIYFDNIEFSQIKGTSKSLPREVREKALITVTSDAQGRVFFDKSDIPFNITVKNKIDTAKTYTLRYRVLKDGSAVYEDSSEISLSAGERSEFEVPVKTDGYGYYYLETTLWDSDEVLVSQGIDYKFSVANIPDESLRNENLGIQITTSAEINQNDKYVDFELMNKLGFAFIRGSGIGFGSVSEDGELSVDEWTRKWIEHCHDNGIEILNILAYGNSKITPENPPRSEDALKAFGKYAVDYCTIYEEIYGHAPEYVDVWNEYWMEGSNFNVDRATPEDYANMLKAIHDALSDTYPDTEIWGLSGVGFENIEWTRRVLEAGGGAYLDAFTLHPYYNTMSPEEADVVDVVNQYKELFKEFGFADKPVYASEWGWPSVANSGYPDEEEQAAYFVRANILNSTNNMFDKIVWYGSNDVGNENTKEERFGLLRGAYAEIAYEAKPIYLAVANYQSQMIGATFEKTVRNEDGIHAYQYTLRDGSSAIVAWKEAGTGTLELEISADDVVLADMYGNERIVIGNSNVYSIGISEFPCFIKGDF